MARKAGGDQGAAAAETGPDTPAMRQWAQAKEQAPDALLFFRMGDFYELFFQDAEEIAATLGLTLTSRNKDRSVPMAGVPYHSADQYIRRLLVQGYRIAICEQLEDPALTKGLVKRGVVRVITPGTVIEDSLLPGESNNFLAAICPPIDTAGFLGFQAGRRAPTDRQGRPLVDFATDWGASWLDLSTGAWGYEEGSREVIEDLLASLSPAELLVSGPTWNGKYLTSFRPTPRAHPGRPAQPTTPNLGAATGSQVAADAGERAAGAPAPAPAAATDPNLSKAEPPPAAAPSSAKGPGTASAPEPHPGRTLTSESPRLNNTAVVACDRAQFDPLLAAEALAALFARRKQFEPPPAGPGLGACGAILYYLRATQIVSAAAPGASGADGLLAGGAAATTVAAAAGSADVAAVGTAATDRPPLATASFSGGLKGFGHVEPPERAGRERGMVLEGDAARHLELVDSSAGPMRSLVGTLRLNKTAVGTRLMRQWLCQPLKELKAIEERQDCIAAFLAEGALLHSLREGLAGMGDLERLTARVCTERANARDLAALATGLGRVAAVRERLAGLEIGAGGAGGGTGAGGGRAPAGIRRLAEALVPPEAVLRDITSTLRDGELPVGIADGEMIADGVNAELDRLRSLAGGGKDWIARLERSEQERTGIGSLKVGYNRVFGYYLEITHTHAKAVPADYIRKQTLTNAERYVTPELKQREEEILSAESRAQALEYKLLSELRARVALFVEDLQAVARAAAELDVLTAWAEVARTREWIRPAVVKGRAMNIVEGRHPVLETLLPAGEYVANDVVLDPAERQILILTGPNMAGKSTYLRQTALLVILAQAGCYIPARSATIGVVDRLFTRIGARDDLTAGRSTFMVEMTETAHILRRATPQSLVILDEVGRGTSTFDGLSIAWAMVEYFHDAKERGARVLFATHYHELTEIAQTRRRVANCHVEVREYEGRLAFLYRVAPGAALRSFGIGVARLAGLPLPLVARATAILKELESADAAGHIRETLTGALRGDGQLSLFGDPKMLAVIDALRALDPDTLTLDEVKHTLRELIAQARRI
ncbi:MAG: DNA mismatch repair protein MutS [Planctomycetota bacterium]